MTEASNLMHVISSDAMPQTAPGSAIACVVGHPATDQKTCTQLWTGLF